MWFAWSIVHYVILRNFRGGDLMDKFILDIYSNGDLYMMMAKIFSWMVVMLLMAVILGCFRGLRL